MHHSLIKKSFEDTKGVIPSCKLWRDRKYNHQKKEQKDKQWSTKLKINQQKICPDVKAERLLLLKTIWMDSYYI